MKERRGIQSIEVGGQLLLALVHSARPMALGDLARAADMPAAKAHPYLVSFCNLGLIRQDSLTGMYQLGPFALQLGLVALHGLDPVREALPEVAQLAAQIDQAVALAVWGNLGPTIVHYQESNNPIHVNMRTGTVMSLVESATGRLFAAYLPPKLTEKLAKEEIQRTTESAAAARALEQEFQQALVEIRRKGMDRANGRPIPGINAVSAPVFDYAGNIVLVITAVGPAGTLNTTWDGEIARAVRECAARVSQHVGHIVPADGEKKVAPRTRAAAGS
ncbi:MAG TPA: IclR family transcriptional regulator [Burkholderiaceae bacterium]|nr:IclR family transcriptional regulator [Burkholderiaceae bacterium]